MEVSFLGAAAKRAETGGERRRAQIFTFFLQNYSRAARLVFAAFFEALRTSLQDGAWSFSKNVEISKARPPRGTATRKVLVRLLRWTARTSVVASKCRPLAH